MNRIDLTERIIALARTVDGLEELEQALRKYDAFLIPIEEVTMADISGRVIQLARQYLKVIEDIERGRRRDLTPEYLEWWRSECHDKFIQELRRCGIDVSDRSSTTALAERIDMWIREED